MIYINTVLIKCHFAFKLVVNEFNNLLYNILNNTFCYCYITQESLFRRNPSTSVIIQMASLLRVMRRAHMPGLSHIRGHSTYPLTYSDEVREAKANGKPIVALESTIITHGMPYPRNLETALEVEDVIRRHVSVLKLL